MNGVLFINGIGGSEISADIKNSIHRKLKSFGRMFSQFPILSFLQNCLISKRSRFNPDIAEMMSLFGDEFLDSPFITQEPASCEKDSFKSNWFSESFWWFGYSDVSDNLTLVTLWWWQFEDIDDRNIILVTFFVMLVTFAI